MKSNYSTLMQSKYFSPAFNSAIFDGPIRIYFAQFHEAQALKIYFLIQQKLAKEVLLAKDISKALAANILLMVYPTEESFLQSFEFDKNSPNCLSVEAWNEDVVIGLRGPIEDDSLDFLIETVRLQILKWGHQQSVTRDYEPALEI